MKLDALDHPKTLDLAARLNVELPTVIGYLELLWAFTAKKAPRGNIGKWPDGSIARACHWNADPATFVTAVIDAGFIDRHDEHRYVVHDWHEHAFGWVRAKLKKTGQSFIMASSKPSNEQCIEASLVPTSEASQGSQVKSSHIPPSVDASASKDDVWKLGKRLLASEGLSVQAAGSFLGKLIKQHGESAVSGALAAASLKRPADLRQWLTAYLNRQHKSGDLASFAEKLGLRNGPT